MRPCGAYVPEVLHANEICIAARRRVEERPQYPAAVAAAAPGGVDPGEPELVADRCGLENAEADRAMHRRVVIRDVDVREYGERC